METVKYNHRWNNLNRRAKACKNQQEQNTVNKEILNYIRILQDQVTELKQMLDDDGK